MPDVDRDLRKCLEFQATQDGDDKKRGIPWPTLIVALAAAAVLGYFLVTNWLDARLLGDFTVALKETPGLYIANATRDGDQFVIDGMRDPLATPVSEVAERFDIQSAQIVENLTPFQSLEPVIVARRVENVLVDVQGISYTISSSNLVINGEAPRAWLDSSRPRLLAIAGIDTVDTANVVDSDLKQLIAEIDALSGSRFLFSGSDIFAPAQEDALRAFAEKLALLQSRAAQSNHAINVRLKGSTDATGEASVNAEIARKRVAAVATILSEFKIASGEEPYSGAPPPADDTELSPNLRNVFVDLTVVRSGEGP